MPTLSDFPARGKVLDLKDGKVVFAPANTNYQLHLDLAAPPPPSVGQLVDALVRLKALKVYTVPSGGGFITPIFGPPRIVQGRVLFCNETHVVIRAGLPVIVELPSARTAIDLFRGPIAPGSIVNVVANPGATFQATAILSASAS